MNQKKNNNGDFNNRINNTVNPNEGILKGLDYAKDAFLHNPIASATDTTGYVQRVPFGEFEAGSYEDMFDVPVSYEKEKRD